MDNYKEMIKISNKRTKVCVSNLSEMCLQNNGNIDLYKFFLNETLAQLQLDLIGVSDEFQENTNPKIRKSFEAKIMIMLRICIFFIKRSKKEQMSSWKSYG